MADFGNPLVLGGNYDVLSTEIFFAIVGAQYDQSRAAILAIVLLGFTLVAFYAQRFWIGKKNYTTVSGKGDAGVHPRMPRRLSIPIYLAASTWTMFTVIIYTMIVYGSFVELWGVNNALTFKHYLTAFSNPIYRDSDSLDRFRLGQFLDHDSNCSYLRSPDRGHRPDHCLFAFTTKFCREEYF